MIYNRTCGEAWSCSSSVRNLVDVNFLDERFGSLSTPVLSTIRHDLDMDSPSRQPVPQFGAWRDYGPESPTIDYSQAFAKARASRLGSMPARQESMDFETYSFHYHSEDEPSSLEYQSSDNLPMTRSPKRTFFHFFVCGSRKERAIA
ncbi:hypothetical protein R1flu_003142 [Riccia fluitans]|uniref:RIN4 pathogenic type III effector avirulence factor Avr cleavage site domain-containing protein n=1 Tax=Riccia fluitans TaxID=41844 RepID=A0ABD1YBJ8_9MARC